VPDTVLGEYRYEYDGVGNRTRADENGAHQRYRYADDSHRLLGIDGIQTTDDRYNVSGNPAAFFPTEGSCANRSARDQRRSAASTIAA